MSRIFFFSFLLVSLCFFELIGGNLSEMREDYSQDTLISSGLVEDPIEQFNIWFKEAVQAGVLEPNALYLATASAEGVPSSRMVLLKSFSQEGFVFFTNYMSRKGRDLQNNPCASMTFFWKELERQVHIRGRVEKISTQESVNYFHTRPFGSQISAWISNQGEPIASREALEEKYQHALRLFKDRQVPLPENWGGYRLIPEEFEFWQGRSCRLHDRFFYSKKEEGEWRVQRLSP